MSTIYKGIAEIGEPQRTDYFAGVRESLEKIQSEKEKKNQDRLDALSKIPLENESKMWGEDLGVLRKMHEDLREGLEEASKSPEAMAAWERDLEYANKYQTVSEEQYAVTAPEALRNAEIAKNPSMNPYSKDGARDSRSSDYYTEEIKNHDNENRFESIKKAPGEGWEMSNGQPITDHFLTEEKKRWSQPDLELMDAASPDGWWPSNVGRATTDTPEEALSRIKGKIERSESDTNNAIVWYSQTANEGKGMPIENVDEKIAIDEYAKEALKFRTSAKESDNKKKTEKSKSVIENGNISSASEVENEVDAGGNQAIFPTAKSTFTFDNSDMPRARYGDAEKLRRVVSISFDGQDYTALFEDGEQVNINFNPMEGEVSYFDEISGQIDANMPGGESLREIIRRLYEAQQKELQDQ